MQRPNEYAAKAKPKNSTEPAAIVIECRAYRLEEMKWFLSEQVRRVAYGAATSSLLRSPR